jgi:hypothetical protein
MRIVEVVRRALLELGHVSDEELAGYVLDAFGIRTHPRLVSAVRRSMKEKEKARSARRRRAECRP